MTELKGKQLRKDRASLSERSLPGSDRNSAIFIGAGASVPFGFPPTKRYVEELESKIVTGDPPGNLLRKRARRHLPGVEDAEHIIEILDSIEEIRGSRARKLFDDMRVTIETVYINDTYDHFESAVLKLQGRIRELIFDTYRWRKEASAQLRLYNLLFSMLDSRVLDVFTTNYDRVIEEFSYSSNLDLNDGFRLDRKRRVWEWHPEIMDDSELDPSKACLRLHKLHGSLNWWKTADGRIEQVRPEARIGMAGGDYTENVLIYRAH